MLDSTKDQTQIFFDSCDMRETRDSDLTIDAYMQEVEEEVEAKQEN